MIYYLDNIRDLVDEVNERRTPPIKRDPADDSFPESDFVAKKGFSYTVLGA